MTDRFQDDQGDVRKIAHFAVATHRREPFPACGPSSCAETDLREQLKNRANIEKLSGVAF